MRARRASKDDLDRLFFGVAQQLLQAAFLADAGILQAAIGRTLEVVADPIDPDAAGLHPARRVDRALDVLGPHRRREPIFERVGKLDDRVLVAPGEHGDYRPENLLARDLHLRMNVAEHRRLDPVATLELLAGRPLATGHQLSAVVDARLDHHVDAV